MSLGSLFSGIGGLEFGLEACGLGPVLWQVENDPFCRSVLARRWPDAARTVYDVRHAGRHNLPRVTVVSAGFPCQPVSLAGARLAQEDARWLWPEAARIIGELGPRYVFLENVPGLLSANGGRAFGDVLGSLASLGYDAEWDCFRASDVGAPHRRERWFLLAYRHGQRKHEPRGGSAKSGDGLSTAVKAEAWPTPCAAHNSGGNRSPYEGAPFRPSLARLVLHPTPTVASARRAALSAGHPHDPPAEGSLNPAWVECLMGFPEGWTVGPPVAESPSARGNPRAQARRSRRGPRG